MVYVYFLLLVTQRQMLQACNEMCECCEGRCKVAETFSLHVTGHGLQSDSPPSPLCSTDHVTWLPSSLCCVAWNLAYEYRHESTCMSNLGGGSGDKVRRTESWTFQDLKRSVWEVQIFLLNLKVRIRYTWPNIPLRIEQSAYVTKTRGPAM
jgi:hypothetical protein